MTKLELESFFFFLEMIESRRVPDTQPSKYLVLLVPREIINPNRFFCCRRISYIFYTYILYARKSVHIMCHSYYTKLEAYSNTVKVFRFMELMSVWRVYDYYYYYYILTGKNTPK